MSSTDIQTIDTCTHPKLAFRQDNLSGDHCYQCMECGKQVIIPWMSIVIEEDNKHPLSHDNANAAIYRKVAGIVGLAFGEQWEKEVMESSNAYTH